MNTNKIKTYAPKARRDFIAAVTRRAGTFGLTAKGASPVREEGQLVFIEGQPYPRSVGAQRQKLAERVKQHGFAQTMEAAAYTWFNRLIAIRFMELHGYLDHSFRVLSHPAGQALPEVLGHAEHLDLPGLDRERVIALKMDGNRDEELYRDLLLAQCRALHRAMPFLFERVDDQTELLLPDNLLQTDSLIRDLVSTIPEDDWQEVEIIGWLYQFYISEKKDQVIGKVVKSEDIPAATQLFTPNWIVQYLVQNSVGRLWLMANPVSTLKDDWPYYIEPAEQTPEVQAQLDALIALRCREGGDRDKGIGDRGGKAPLSLSDYPLSPIPYSLDPESITVLDPACGSGHILVVAYDVLKAIYLERGYRPRDIPRLILEKNLYGLDIDDRAAQLAGFALLMKARADDRRLLDDPPRLNVLALQESKGLSADELTRSLQPMAATVGRVSPEGVTRQQVAGFAEDDLFPGTFPQMSLGESVVAEASGYAALTRPTIAALIDTFAEAKTFGSLIQIPPTLVAMLPELNAALLQALDGGDVFARAAAEALLPLVRQASVLAMQFDAVVANPPYMGSGGMNDLVKQFVGQHFPDAKQDLSACFIERNIVFAKAAGFCAMITMQSWMFLWSFEAMRERVFREKTIVTMAHLGPRAFKTISGEVVQTVVFVIRNLGIPKFQTFVQRLTDGDEEQKREMLSSRTCETYAPQVELIRQVPGAPFAYWAPQRLLRLFQATPLSSVAASKGYVKTGNNKKFIRYHWEVRRAEIGRDSKWRRHPRGGEFRRWYGNVIEVVRWDSAAREHYREDSIARLLEDDYWNAVGICWSEIAADNPAFRILASEEIANNKSVAIYLTGVDESLPAIIGFLNTIIAREALRCLNPTIGFGPGDVLRLPWVASTETIRASETIVPDAIRLAKKAWDSYEISSDFALSPLVPTMGEISETLENSYLSVKREACLSTTETLRLEEENNRLFIDAYGLWDDFTPQVPIEQITLAVNPAYRYDGKLTEEQQWARFRQDTMKELVSYAIGCMMGRYRLDRPGLIYAHSGNQNFEAIYNAVNEESTDDTDEHRLRNANLCKSVSSVDNSSFSPTDGVISAAREESTVEHRSRNEYLCSSVSSVDKNPFPADADGIVPITDLNWFDDDAANRIREFLLAVWGAETLNENMAWLAESLGSKSGETPDEIIRRYLSASFFKDHLQTYKRRPIYWCFSSGKQKAFEALVYLHRYHEGTLARMRMEYVVPLQGKMAARIDRLSDDIASASTTAQAKRLQKERDKLTRQLDELRRYDEQLRHYADQRIALDLDDGVKVNYAKFGYLLAEVKAVTGTSAE